MATGPFMSPPARTTRRRRSSRSPAADSAWRIVLPVLFVLAVLALAPAFAMAQGADTVVVRWTAPGDDAQSGTAAVYDLRVSESPINAQNFAQASTVANVPAPLVAGTSQTVTVHGLTAGRTYWFAIRTADDRGNWSPLSNVVQYDWILDTAAPAPPRSVSVLAASDGVHLSWAPNAEPDLAGYNVYRSLNGAAPVRINETLVTTNTFVDTNAPANGQGAEYEVTAVDTRGNESAHTTTGKIDAVTSTHWVLQPAYPNPSRNGETVHLPVYVPASATGSATVQIVDSGGRLVRQIPLVDPLPGNTEVTWDGMNDAGRATAPGVYRGWLVQDGSHASVRLLRVP